MPYTQNAAPGSSPCAAPAAQNASTASGSIGSAPLSASRHARQVETVEASQGSSRERVREVRPAGDRAARTPTSTASSRPARRGSPAARRARGRTRWSSASPSSPMSPMSWYSGSHETTSSDSVSASTASTIGVDVRGEAVVRQHHALRVRGRPARELQDPERVGVVGRALAAAGRRRAARRAARSAGRRARGSRNGASCGSTTTTCASALDDAPAGLRDELLDRASRIGRGRHTTVAPASQVAWIAVTNGRVVGPSRATWPPGPTPRAWRAAAMPRASSWRRDHSTRSQPSAPADATKVIARRVSAVASSRGRSEADWLTKRIGPFLPGMGLPGKRHRRRAGSWKKRERGRATSAPSARAASSASGSSWRP